MLLEGHEMGGGAHFELRTEMKWVIRDAGAFDVDSLAGLVERCLGESWTRSALAEALASPMARVRLLARAGPEPEGFLVARRVADFVEIDLLGVAPESRRCGGAAALLGDLKRSECDAGAEQLRLELRESNRSAGAFYADAGFVVVGRRARYYPDGEDALLLTCMLTQRSSSEPSSPKRES